MVKLSALLVPRRGLTPAAFHEHWAYVHGPLAGKIRRARAYVQCHRLPWQPVDVAVLPHGGVAEVWFDSVESAEGLMDDPDYTENAGRDEDNFHYMGEMTALRTDQRVVRAGPPLRRDTRTAKLFQLVRRRPGTSPEEFVSAWLADGDGAAPDGLHVQREVRGALIEPDRGPDVAWDGLRELWWPDEWSLIADRSLRAPAWDTLLDHPAIDAPASAYLVTAEHRVVWPENGADDLV